VHYGGGVTFFPDELGLEMDGASEGERPLLSVPASALTVAARARAAGIGGGGRFLFREFRSLTSGVRTRVKSARPAPPRPARTLARPRARSPACARSVRQRPAREGRRAAPGTAAGAPLPRCPAAPPLPSRTKWTRAAAPKP
jgi:hypothetical protein